MILTTNRKYNKLPPEDDLTCLFETCRGCYQNKIQRKVHLVGSVIQFITLHRQYNIENKFALFEGRC
jgi:hypothetical protein